MSFDVIYFLFRIFSMTIYVISEPYLKRAGLNILLTSFIFFILIFVFFNKSLCIKKQLTPIL